ncbi:MAG TPA: TraR/DksA C4-type zinc finger protein [Planctomycetota bacterium]|nr:TraR/DksA C4-type zinc finger protein [Planctomycetota bacterium]
MKNGDLALYRTWLLDKLQLLLGDANKLENEVMRSKKDSATLDISKFADLGSDNFEIELDMEMLETQGDEIREVIAALKRMEDGTFGTCTACGKKIAARRLRAIAYARMCVGCKKEEEENGGARA